MPNGLGQPSPSGSWWDTVVDWVDGFFDFWGALRNPDQQETEMPWWARYGAPSAPFDWTSLLPLMVIGGIFIVAVAFIGRK